VESDTSVVSYRTDSSNSGQIVALGSVGSACNPNIATSLKIVSNHSVLAGCAKCAQTQSKVSEKCILVFFI